MSTAPEESANPNDYRQSWRNSFQVYAWIWNELLSEKSRRSTKKLAVLVFVKNVALLLVPWLLSKLVSAIGHHDETGTQLFSAGITGVLLFNWGLQFCESGLREVIFGENMGSIDLSVSRRFLALSHGQHLRENEVLSPGSLERGRGRANEMMNLLCTEVPSVFSLLLVSYIGVWLLSVLAGIAVTLIFAVYFVWALYLNHQVALVCAPLDVVLRAWTRYRVGRWDGVSRVKTMGMQDAEDEYLTTEWDKFIALDRDFWLWFLRSASYRNLVCLSVFLMVIGYATWSTWRVGGYTSLFPLFVWMYNILNNMWQIGNIEHRLGWSTPSLQSMQTALQLKPDIVVKPNAPLVDASEGIHLLFDRVCFRYKPSVLRPKENARASRQVLKNFQLKIAPGERVAVIGPSGVGKSTVMQLLHRSFDPDSGEIRVNGVDLRDLDLASWLKSVGYIPQKATIFEGSVRDALLYGLTSEQKRHVTDDFLWNLLVRLKIADRMVDKLNTKLGNGGIELSGGEAQRIMVAAALAKRATFYVIDEATSALDSVTEQAVQEALEEALRGKTGAFVIAHRLSTVRYMCNRFIVLGPAADVAEGESQIEADAGSFEELYAISPTFRQLADAQGLSIKLAA